MAQAWKAFVLAGTLCACTVSGAPGNQSALIPEDCVSWFDGCNFCTVLNGTLGACTRKFCSKMEEPKCIKFGDSPRREFFWDRFFPDPEKLREGYTGIQLILMGICYSFFVAFGARLISRGAELLSLLKYPAVFVGGTLIPLLEQLPCVVMVVYSALPDDAQQRVYVAFGAVVGRTLSLLTLFWAIIIHCGRAPLRGSVAHYKMALENIVKKTSKLSYWCSSAVTRRNTFGGLEYLLLGTLIPFLVSQGLDFGKRCKTLDGAQVCDTVFPPSAWLGLSLLCSLILCIAFFAIQYQGHGYDPISLERIAAARANALRRGDLSLTDFFPAEAVKAEERHAKLLKKDDKEDTFKDVDDLPESFQHNIFYAPCANQVLVKFFDIKRHTREGTLNSFQLKHTLKHMGKEIDDDYLSDLMELIEKPLGDVIDFDDFSKIVGLIIKQESRARAMPIAEMEIQDEDEDADELPMSRERHRQETEKHFRKITIKGVGHVIMGLVLILLFSSPLVHIYYEVAWQLGWSPFFIALILTPWVTSVPQYVTSYRYATRKTKDSITFSMSIILLNSAVNNIFGYGTMLMMIWRRDLVWRYGLANMTLILPVLIMGILATVKTQRCWWVIPIVLLYAVVLVVAIFIQVEDTDPAIA